MTLNAEFLHSPCGRLFAAASDTQLYALLFTDRDEIADELLQLGRKRYALTLKTNVVLETLKEELHAYFHKGLHTFRVPLYVDAAPFTMAVWKALQSIPYSQTVSYSELAVLTGRPAAVRAAGTACGKNPLSIVIPCHRVVKKQGGLGQYGGGSHRKEFLLNLERQQGGLDEKGV